MAKSARRYSAAFNEKMWQTEIDPDVLIDGLRALVRDGWSHLTRRRFRLFGAALARRVVHLLPAREWDSIISLVEECDDGEALAGDVCAARLELSSSLSPHPEHHPPPYTEEWSRSCACNAVLFCLERDDRNAARQIEGMKWATGWAAGALIDHRLLNIPNPTRAKHERRHLRQQQADLLRHIFGNPFRKVAFDKGWRTSTVVALAAQMYDSRDFSAMPILVDALQDAGCDNTTVLNHCRDANQIHVRGCWVVDLLLGKK